MRSFSLRELLLLLALITVLLGCVSGEPAATLAPPTVAPPELTLPPDTPVSPSTATPLLIAPEVGSVALGTTTHRQDGNRLAVGKGALPNQVPLSIPLSGNPTWVVGAPFGTGVLWVALVDDGDPGTLAVAAHVVEGGQSTEIRLAPERVKSGPLLLEVRGDEARLVVAPTTRSGPTTPVSLDPNRGLWAYANLDSGLLVIQGREPIVPDPLDVSPLPDGRLLTDDNGRILMLTNPTDRYAHGVLGDALEAGSVTLIETHPTPHIARVIQVPGPSVIEGVAPIWTDWNGDGQREIIVTQSNQESGAQIVLYEETGRLLAVGPAIGSGNRWRHQLAVAPFGPGGEMELADVLTPHLGGIVEFYRWEGDALTIVASLPGYTSHVIGSRNLDMAIAGDFDGDDRIELLLPNQRRSELGAIRRVVDGVEVAWTLPLPGRLQTNLAAATQIDGALALAAGVEGQRLLVWQR